MLQIFYSTKRNGFMNYQKGHEDWNQKADRNRNDFLAQCNIDPANAFFSDPESKTRVVNTDAIHGLIPGKCDGLFTRKKGIALCVGMADCFPVVIHDPKQNALALLHCGWKGVSMDEGIISVAMRWFGMFSADVEAHIGPGICSHCYEFDPSLARRNFDERFIMIHGGRHVLNLAGAIVDKLTQSRIRPDNINLTNAHCTMEYPMGGEIKTYFSARRDRKSDGKYDVSGNLIQTPLETGMCVAILQ